TKNADAIQELFDESEELLNEIVDLMKIDEVRSDEAFEKTTEKVRNRLLLTPVSFGEPYIIEDRRGYRGGSIDGEDCFVVTVAFPFTGSSEIIGSRPTTGDAFPDGHLYKAYGNTVPIEV